MTEFDPDLSQRLERAGISVQLTAEVLGRINRGDYFDEPVTVDGIPDIDGRSILDMRALTSWRGDTDRTRHQADLLSIPGHFIDTATQSAKSLVFDRSLLRSIGDYLLPTVSYGILNGGSATSYADMTKNSQFDPEIFDLYRDIIGRVAPKLEGKPKGTTPAFYDETGHPGPDFIELKMRQVLLTAFTNQRRFESSDAGRALANIEALFPMFQMTSVTNNDQIARTYAEYRRSPYIAQLIEQTGLDVTNVLTGVQPMIAAFSHSSEGVPRSIFVNAMGRPDRVLPLPGGHGQCFTVLRGVFSELLAMGKKFVTIGNVDNLGNSVDPIEVAILALSGRMAGFDFSFRTPVDVKGGILVRESNGGLTCADIGPAVSPDMVRTAEMSGSRVLFNCASGIFSLSTIFETLDEIAAAIPLRLSDQDKDAGRYSQAEQITWEIIGILDDPLIFAVQKNARFLASKLLIENILTSGVFLDAPRFVAGSAEMLAKRRVAYGLHEGLVRALTGVFGLQLRDGTWSPREI